MEDNDLITRLQQETGTVLQDSRKPNLRRNKQSTPCGTFERFAYGFALVGYKKRLNEVYAALASQRLVPRREE